MLRYLYVDMNSYFASVEQQDHPKLRGKPVAVIPMKAETTCCIAASYEAKAFGVRTGSSVRQARQLCPGIIYVLARPKRYVQVHHRIIDAVESRVHIERVCSIDEMFTRLYCNERDPEQATGIAHEIKRAIRESVGPWVRCSIGVGPNVWLAKVATDLEKPDGLVMIRPDQLPDRIAHLKLTDLPGIARGMSRRLAAHGVRDVRGLYHLSKAQLQAVSGSRVWATTWFDQLRGDDLPIKPTLRRTVGHSHVLPPAQRTDEHARAVLVRMIHKAGARLRRLGYWTSRLQVSVEHVHGPPWRDEAELGLVRDTLSMVQAGAALWSRKPPGTPMHLSVVLTHLTADRCAPIPLFEEQRKRNALADVMDRIDQRYGTHAIHIGAMLGYTASAPTRISYTQIPLLHEFE